MNIIKILYKAQVAMFVIIAVFVMSSAGLAATYYVDAINGDNSNDGLSPSTAWETIPEVNSSIFSHRDKIIFKKGEIWLEQLDILSSSSAGNPITNGAYDVRNNSIILGSEVITGWTPYAPTIWQSTLQTKPKGIKSNNTWLVEGYSKDFLKEGEWFWESNVLYLNDTEGNPDVTGKTITAVVRSGGWSVTSGDFNGDGLSDVVDSNHGAEVYVHYGNDEFSTMPDQILTDPEGDWFLGFYVASAGDVNNDGFDELIVAMNWGINKVYLYMGTPQGLSDTPDIILIPPDSYPEYGFGHGISRAGDVNGDGFADILIAGGGDSPTYFCLYLGSPSGINISPNLVVTYSDKGGIVNVSTIGDINNDGFDDIAVSNAETPPASSFNVYVYYGASNGIIADNPQVLKISIPIAETYRNGTVAPAGDLNGDGFADLLVGNQWASGIYWGEGKAYIFYGSSAGLSDSPDIIIDNPEPEFNVRFGKSVDGISDFNYDGFDDIIVGCPYGDNSNGYASIYYSSPEGFANTPSLTLAEVKYLRYYGWSVSHVGDIKGNGQNFIIVGEEFGGAYLYILTSEAINVNDMVALAPELDTSINPDPVANAPAGTFTITATFTNKSSSPHILNPFFKVAELSGENLLLNADCGAGGVGATLTPDVGDDGVLSPGESFTVDFVIGLQTRNRFRFFVDLLGVPGP